MMDSIEHSGFLFGYYKPSGPTSHDCVSQVRHALGTKKVGHAGTLDPSAEGVLIMGVGSATKLLAYLGDASKVYDARITFGSETLTDDAEGKIRLTAEVPQSVQNEAFAREALASFVGKSMQVPPHYSAVSQGGVRAYKAAREGKPLELKAREINVIKAELLSLEKGDTPVWHVRFEVSSGCYIRSLARDIGKAVGSAAHLSGLVRECVGSVILDQCLLESQLSCAFENRLDPFRLCGLTPYELSDAELKEVSFGRPFKASKTSQSLFGVTHGEKLYGIWKNVGEKLMCVQNFAKPIMGSSVCQA